MIARGSRVVDMHLHLIPEELVADIERGAFPNVGASRHEAGLVFDFPGMAPSPPAQRALLDLQKLAHWRAAESVDLQLAGPWTDLLGYTLSDSEAVSWARAYNERLVAVCAEDPQLVPVGTVPLQHPGLAAVEIEAACRMGCRGVMVGTDVPGIAFDSPTLDAVWEVAAALRMPIILHPTFVSVPPRLRQRGLKNAVGRAGEATVALTQLVYSGALLKHPELSVIAALGGGGFVPLMQRIVCNYELGWSGATTDVTASLARLYFDTCLGDPAYLHFVVCQVGAEHVLLGSDYPFPWEEHPVRKVELAGLATDETGAVLGANARHLFRLDSATV